MPSAAVISKPSKPELKQLVSGVVDWLERHGYQVVLDPVSSSHVSGSKCASREQLHNYKLDFAVVLGGDGTLLAAARALAHANVPLLAVNLGSLGFLTEVPLAELYATLDAWCAGCAKVEIRSMIRADLTCDNGSRRSFDALNDIVVAKGSIARM